MLLSAGSEGALSLRRQTASCKGRATAPEICRGRLRAELVDVHAQVAEREGGRVQVLALLWVRLTAENWKVLTNTVYVCIGSALGHAEAISQRF